MNTPFKMKGFSGFGNSPLRQDKKDLPTTPTDSTTTTKSDTTWTEVPGSRTTEVMGTKEDEKNMRKNMSGGKNAGKSSKSRMLDAFKDEFPD